MRPTVVAGMPAGVVVQGDSPRTEVTQVLVKWGSGLHQGSSLMIH